MNDYEMVIGLEVHAELATATKIFCGCSTAFGAPPNTQCCPVCTGLPGTLPVLNGRVVELAAVAGLATHCTIARESRLERKNYFYPDLPKAYQISQYELPLCSHGWLDVNGGRVGITRIHIEEDAGKLVHTDEGTLCDYNRCGVPLIEIVSEPDLRSAEDAVAYLRQLRAILRYTGVSDCKMQEGSLRCDVNLSVRKRGETALGTRTEMKNLNSFAFIQKAIAFEFARQVALVERGEAVPQETRRFDPATGRTETLRGKEDADDYRYFPDPDLPPVVMMPEQLERLRAAIPELPDARAARYVDVLGVAPQDAAQIVAEREAADWFEAAAALTPEAATVAKLLTGEIFRLWEPETPIPLPPACAAELADLAAAGRVNSNTAKRLIGGMWTNPEPPSALADREGLWQIHDRERLRAVVESVVAANPKAAAQYRKGKTNALQAIVGQCMGATGGLGNPVVLRELALELLA